MDRTNQPPASPADILRAEIARQERILPIFIRPRLGDTLGKLDAWVTSVEQRLSRIEGVKSWVGPLSVPAETLAEENRDRELRRLALIARGNCENCE